MAEVVATSQNLQPLDSERLWIPERDMMLGSLCFKSTDGGRADLKLELGTQQLSDRLDLEARKQRIRMSQAVGGLGMEGRFFDPWHYDDDISYLEKIADRPDVTERVAVLQKELAGELRKERNNVFGEQLQALNAMQEEAEADGVEFGIVLRTGASQDEQLRTADLVSFYMATNLERGNIMPGILLGDWDGKVGTAPEGWSVLGLGVAHEAGPNLTLVPKP